MIWKTQTGEEIDIRDMSNEHLDNAIKHVIKNNAYGLVALGDEQRRRKEKAFFAKKEECPWCSNVMTPRLIKAGREVVGFSIPEYRFLCQKCGATGPKTQRE